MAVNQSMVRRRRAKALRIGEASAAERSLGDVILYESDGAGVRLEVRLERETVWLTQAQMAELFQRDRTVVTRHVNNVFEEGELDEESNVQKMHIASGDRPTSFYSLDVVVSVGYRVKSPRGTQVRIWATRTLKDHLIRGYTLNEQRLRERGFTEIRQAVALLGRTLTQNDLVTDEGRAVLQVIDQGSPVCRRQQAHRYVALSRISAAKRLAEVAEWDSEIPRQRDGGHRATGGGK